VGDRPGGKGDALLEGKIKGFTIIFHISGREAQKGEKGNKTEQD